MIGGICSDNYYFLSLSSPAINVLSFKTSLTGDNNLMGYNNFTLILAMHSRYQMLLYFNSHVRDY